MLLRSCKHTYLHDHALNAKVWDLGAKDGNFLASLRPAKEALAVEPVPSPELELRARYYRFDVERAALIDVVADDTPRFYLSDIRAANSFFFREDVHRENDTMVVPRTTVEHLAKQYFWPEFVKIDIEGMETYVLEAILAMYPIQVTVEFHDQWELHTSGAVRALLCQMADQYNFAWYRFSQQFFSDVLLVNRSINIPRMKLLAYEWYGREV